MYEIRKNVKVKDFDEETKEFLLDIGLSCEDDLSSMFEEFLKKKNIDMNEGYTINNTYTENLELEKCPINNMYADNLELEKCFIYQYKKEKLASLKDKKSKCFENKLNGKLSWMYQRYNGVGVC